MTHSTAEIQKRLTEKGFNPGPIDGEWGPHTESALMAFKLSVGLGANSIYGPKTELALFGELVIPNNPILTSKLPWIKEAVKWIGLEEREDNDALKAFLASDGYALGDPAKFPWCGDFVETCIRLALPMEVFIGNLAKNPYWALNWREFGLPTSPVFGAVVSISRDGGGHVAFAVGEDKTRYYCLGGNQKNRVCVVPIEKTRFSVESWRWPVSYARELALPLPKMTSSQASSVNEQ